MLQRRSFLMTVLVSISMSITGLGGVAAQDATPTSATFADTMGLPELRVQITDTAFEGLPAETAPGRYLLTLEVSAAEGAGLNFLRLPEGMRFDEFMAVLAAPPEGEGEDRPPEWFFQAEMAGGTAAFAGTAQAIIDLTPGEWIAWAGYPDAPQAPVGLTVTGEAGGTPAAGAEPAADVTVTMFEYDFAVEGSLTPGSHIFAVTNVGAQPHEMFMLRAPGPVTEEQIAQVLEMEMQGGTPAPDGDLPNPDEFIPATHMTSLSMGKTGWIPVTLETGTYIVLCFVPDIESGMPHAYHGMYQVITVGDEGTPTA